MKIGLAVLLGVLACTACSVESHQKPFVGGFFNANKPIQYQRIEPVLNNFPDQDSLNLLNELGVEYIVLNHEAYEDLDEVEKYLTGMGLTKLIELNGQSVFLIHEVSVE